MLRDTSFTVLYRMYLKAGCIFIFWYLK